MKIIDVKFDKLNRVVHLADVHIRLFQRHAEYKKSFKKLYGQLKKIDLDQGVIVVAGDILHAKLDMSPEMIELTSVFLSNLAKIAPTLVIDGNHDLNLSNPHRMNSLYPIIKNIDDPDLHYLSESDIYRVADTEFAVFSIIDAYATPENWPSVDDMTAKTKIALYHGPVYGARTDTHYTISSRHVEVGQFDGFDIAMLGDIHTHQVMQKRNKSQNRPVVTYCSSLIQQNHGEKIDGHGYVVWEIPSCKMEFHELKSDTGYATIEITNEDLNKLVIPDNLPKNLRLRIYASNIENTKLKKIIAVIRKKYKLLDIAINPSKPDPQSPSTQLERFDTGDLSNINIQNSLIRDWLLSNYPIISDETIESVEKINKRVNGLINYSDQSRNIQWKPLRFTFSNLFSFGEKNVIDFTNMLGTNGIFAPNASGKSSSMEALSFNLFDKTPRAFRGDHIMNIRKKKFECELSFDVNGETYVIKRVGKKNKKGAVKVDVDFWKENDDGTTTILNGEDRFDTNANIRSIVGTYEDFILTTLSGQTGNSLFIDKSNSERKVLLNQFMGLNIFEQLERIANEESRELHGILKKFSREDFTEQLVSLQTDIEKCNIELLETQTQIDDFDREMDGLQTETETLSSQKIKVPITNMDKGVLLKSKKSLIKKKEQVEKNIDVLILESDLIKDKIDSLELKLDKIDIDELKEVYEKYQVCEKSLAGLEQEYNVLTTSIDSKQNIINQISKFKHNPDCEVCIENNKSKLEQISEINEEINMLSNKTTVLASEIEEHKTDLTEFKEDYDLYLSAVSMVKVLDDYNLSYSSSKNSIDKYTNQITVIESDIKKHRENINQIDEYKESLIKNKNIDESIFKLKNSQVVIKKNITKLTANKMEIHSDLKVKEIGRSSIMEQLEEMTKIEREFEAYRYYMEAINKDGLPYKLISKTIPNIEAEINAILSQIVTFSIALDVDGKNFGGRIVYDHERSWPLENSSGMERFISSLAIRVALLKASNLPKSNFLIIDEGMGSLDTEFLHGMQLMFDLLKSQFDFVIVISHLDNIRDMVDNILEIRSTNGYSHINILS